MNKLLIIGLILLLLLLLFNKKSGFLKSGFNFNSNSEETTDVSEKKNNIDDNTILIFYAPWCGHCKKSLQDFKDAVSQSENIIMINSDDEPDLTKKYNVNGFPTIMKASGEQYSGERDSDSILKFSKS